MDLLMSTKLHLSSRSCWFIVVDSDAAASDQAGVKHGINPGFVYNLDCEQEYCVFLHLSCLFASMSG